jgi:hypothetical protein
MSAARLSRRGYAIDSASDVPGSKCLDQERANVLIDDKHPRYVNGSPSSERGCLLHDARPLRAQLQHSPASFGGSAPDHD